MLGTGVDGPVEFGSPETGADAGAHTCPLPLLPESGPGFAGADLRAALSRADFAAAAISDFALAKVLDSSRCAATKSTSCFAKSRSSSSGVPVTLRGVEIALFSSFSAVLSGFGITLTQISPLLIRARVRTSVRCPRSGMSS